MANYFNVMLDTTAPIGATLSLDASATYTTDTLIDATIGTGDVTVTGYQMKLWGDIDLAWGKTNGVFASGAVTTTEADSLWISYVTSKQLQVSAADGLKSISLKIRDDVYNESGIATSSITLDTTLPTITITGPDVLKISKRASKNTANFSFSVDTPFVQYTVRVVTSSGAIHTAGVQIGTVNGSVNTGATGVFAAATAINCTINGTDLETASAGDGIKTIKVFVQEKDSLNWSV